MPHGAPDFGISPVAAKRGEMVFVDEFDTGITEWGHWGGGLGGLVETSYEYTVSAGYSAKLVVGTGLANYAAIEHYLQRPRPGTYGIEANFTIHGNHDYFECTLYHWDGTNRREWSLQYYPGDPGLRYVDDLGNAIHLHPAIDLFESYYLFHTIKMMIDPIRQVYCWGVLDDVVYDLSGIPCHITIGAITDHLVIHLAYHADGNNVVTGYIDDVILTQKEL